MLWTKLSIELQYKIMNRIADLIKEENDDQMIDGIIAAVHELNCWSNRPCEDIESSNSKTDI